jgi:hypothetical protein
MQEQTPNHYTDTRTMFDYCFENFKLLYAADYETEEAENQDVSPFASVDEDAAIVVPVNVSFSDLTREIVYDSTDENVLGTIQYSYGERVVGRADVRMNEVNDSGFAFTDSIYDEEPESTEQEESGETEDVIDTSTDKSRSIHIEINRRTIAIAIGLLVLLVAVVLLIYWLLTHTYLLRQKLAGMRTRRAERTRYRTIRDTRKSRKKKTPKKSKDLRF